MVAQRKNVTKDQWLAVAIDILEKDGVEQVKIQRPAKHLGIARSGFYWHFKNRQELLQNLLDFWTRNYTGVVINDPIMEKATSIVSMADNFYGLSWA